MTLKIGSIVYNTRSGLGLLAKDFYDNGILNRVLVIPHPHYKMQQEWYKNVSYSRPRYKEFLKGLDVLLLFENAFYWSIPAEAKSMEIKVVLMPMYEWSPYPPPVTPDLVLCPSLLDFDYYKKQYNSAFIPVPINTDKYKWMLRKTARTFVHNAGHGGSRFRNGTIELVEALKYVDSPATFIIRGQPNEKRVKDLFHKLFAYPGNTPGTYRHPDANPHITVKIELADVPDEELYSTGEVFIFPEKFNGLSLPLQEAYASGMLVLATDRYPINTWLLKDQLITPSGYERQRLNSLEFDAASINPVDIANKIDEVYGKDIQEFSLRGKAWAEHNNWKVLKPKYMELLSCL